MASFVDSIEYKLENIPATAVASDVIDKTFRSSSIDLISGTLGGKILAFSDQWFAEAANLLTPTAPIRQPGKMVFTGAWYDGWETRRHNQDPFDWVIVRLGVASGTVEGVEVDTAFFSGNHAPAISVEGCFSDNDEEVVSWKDGRGKWETVLGIQECGPSQRFGWKLAEPTKKQYTHVRLNMYPDGGIARFRLFGHAVPVFPEDKEAIFDLAAAQNGGVAISCSDQHFGTKDNLLLPGRGKDMGDGWETARSRSPGHVDWTIIKLGAPGYIQDFVVDTAHFRGNFPQKVAVQGIEWKGDGEPDDKSSGWVELVAPSKTGPDQEHKFASSAKEAPFTHIKLIMIPDGGVKRIRAFGKRPPTLGALLLKYNIYPAFSSQPLDLRSLQDTLAVPRPSVPPLTVSDDAYEIFRKNVRAAKNGRELIFHLVPALMGNEYPSNHFVFDAPFVTMDPLGDDIPAAQPDLYCGEFPHHSLHRTVREALAKHINPSLSHMLPIVPNFFLECQDLDFAERDEKSRAQHDGAFGARAIHSLQNYGNEEPEYDNQPYTFSATYHEGILVLYAHHVTKPYSEGELPEFHMNQIYTVHILASRESFIEGITAFRNARDEAQKHRDRFIAAANRKRASLQELADIQVKQLPNTLQRPNVGSDTLRQVTNSVQQAHSQPAAASTATLPQAVQPFQAMPQQPGAANANPFQHTTPIHSELENRQQVNEGSTAMPLGLPPATSASQRAVPSQTATRRKRPGPSQDAPSRPSGKKTRTGRSPAPAPPPIMDAEDSNIDFGRPQRKSVILPPDLPKSLDDRRHAPIDTLIPETEMYDGWQGESQFLTTPAVAKPLNFASLSLDEPAFDNDGPKDSDTRLMEMLAAQAAHSSGPDLQDEQAIANDDKMSDEQKRATLQKLLNMAASNGDVEKVQKLLDGSAKPYIDVNATDEDGTPPLIYASCFGHEPVVQTLVLGGADVNKQDRNQWSPLMWAMTNRHKGIAKLLLDNGASSDQKTSSGRTAADFVPPDSEMSTYLHTAGYTIGSAGVVDDFYSPGLSQDRFEEEIMENEMRRRLMMESARDLEVDLGNVGMDDQPESADEFEEEQQEFDWSRCLHDQMFVFQEHELDRILDIVITHMTPQRSPTQKPVPANMIFLSARYAHYHSSTELLERLLITAMDRINDVVERYQWDMTILAFWLSNATLLLHYLKKDAGLVEATSEFQAHLAELINEIFILIVRDAERRLDKVLDVAMLDHEIIPGFEDIQFQNEWKIFKRKPTVKEEPLEKRFRPPSPKQRAKPAPRNVTSLLSSTLFVLDLYDVHSVITSQIISQLIYWIGAELFNRIMSNRKYLARTKAMQIRMNISILEDWARTNNRQAEHYEAGEMKSSGETTADAARHHLAPVIQMLQWIQCFSSLASNDLEALVGTLQQLKRLTPQQLIHAASHYRLEVGEKGLTKSALKYLQAIQKEAALKRDRRRSRATSLVSAPDSSPATPVKKNQAQGNGADTPSVQGTPNAKGTDGADEDYDDAPENLLLDPALMLPFSLPSVTDMLISYGAGFGGVNRERERKYIPTVPPEFLEKLELNGGRKGPMFGEKDWENEEV
ncbi:unnamed protein product [Clonostachys byssicola]|uniref:allantoicase n=1 Tax=Clonostachys byssicola TaxID=160290 RepID=A0A9N9XYU1_9HYPO|nr:unnamed protein product [Clonostachys byssicola]